MSQEQKVSSDAISEEDQRATHNVGEAELWVVLPQLSDTANGAGTNDTAIGHLVETDVGQAVLDDECVRRILAFENRAELATGWKLGGHILEAMDDSIDLSFEQSDLELLGPEICERARFGSALADGAAEV